MATVSYVKFIRGTPAAFKKITTPDKDTLYFISETDSKYGSLYLGSKLISGGEVSLSTIEDIVISEVKDSQLLVYDKTSETWVNKSISDIISIMQGATKDNDGVSGLVPVPKAGEQNLFLRGDGTWASVPSTDLSIDTNIFAKTSDNVLTLKGLEEAPAGSLLALDSNNQLTYVSKSDFYTKTEVNELLSTQLSRKIVGSIDDINLSAVDNSKYIYMVKDGSSEGNLYTEYMVIDGELELIGSTATNLSGYITTTVYQSQVGDLNKLEEGTNLVDEIIKINEKLAWQDISENDED